MGLVMNQAFHDETVIFEKSSFIGCIFKNCIIVVPSQSFNFHACIFYDVTFYVDPKIPIFHFSHRLSQSFYENIVCCWEGIEHTKCENAFRYRNGELLAEV